MKLASVAALRVPPSSLCGAPHNCSDATRPPESSIRLTLRRVTEPGKWGPGRILDERLLQLPVHVAGQEERIDDPEILGGCIGHAQALLRLAQGFLKRLTIV